MSTVAGCRSGSPRGCFSRFCSALVRVQRVDRRQLARGSGCRPGEHGWSQHGLGSRVSLAATGLGQCVSPTQGLDTHWGPLRAQKLRVPGHQQCGRAGLGAAEQLTTPLLPRVQAPQGWGLSPQTLSAWGVSGRGRPGSTHPPTGCRSEVFRFLGQGRCFLGNQRGNSQLELRRGQGRRMAPPLCLA